MILGREFLEHHVVEAFDRGLKTGHGQFSCRTLKKRLLVVLLSENTDEPQGRQQDFLLRPAWVFGEHVVFPRKKPSDFPLDELPALLRKNSLPVP